MEISIGRIVLYKLSQDDLESIMDISENGSYFGNPQEGDILPALVIKVNPDGSINGKVFLDGESDLWIKNVSEGQRTGQWHWPVIDKPAAYKMRYSKLYNTGNYENEKIDIEREFSADTDSVEALNILMLEVDGTRKKAREHKEKIERYEWLCNKVINGEITIEGCKAEMKDLQKELDIKDELNTHLIA